jgi:crossover junction endodeoxyribonuclease RuvC
LTHGVILLQSDAGLADRLFDLSRTLKGLLLEYRPQVIVVEKVFLGKSPESAFKLGHARGIVLAEASASGARVVEISTRYAKKQVTGTGAADKAQVQLALGRLLKLNQFVNEDASDALALAWAEGLKALSERTIYDRMVEG